MNRNPKLYSFCLFNILMHLAVGQTITTVVGNGTAGYGGDGGPASACEIYNPTSTIFDQSGNMYVADWGNVVVRKVNTSGIISIFAGTGALGFSGDGGPATSATFYDLNNLAWTNGNLYVADGTNNRIRKIDNSGIVTSVAGNGSSTYSGDGGPATAAGIAPVGVVIDGSDDLYIADVGNDRVRKINSSGIISTIAGNGTAGFGGDGGIATSANLHSPASITLDNLGNLYIADYRNNRVRKVTTSGIISTIAGTGTAGYSGDGAAAISATLNGPQFVMWTGGALFISDANNHAVRKVNSSGIISTIAGTGVMGYSGDGGPAISAQLNSPAGLSFDNAGNLYICDLANNRVRMINNVVSVNELASQQAINIYPNPVLDKVVFQGIFTEVEIFNSIGYSLTISDQHEIDMSSYSNGIYFLRFRNRDKFHTQKIIVHH